MSLTDLIRDRCVQRINTQSEDDNAVWRADREHFLSEDTSLT